MTIKWQLWGFDPGQGKSKKFCNFFFQFFNTQIFFLVHCLSLYLIYLISMNWFDSKWKTISVWEGILTHNHRITDFMSHAFGKLSIKQDSLFVGIFWQLKLGAAVNYACKNGKKYCINHGSYDCQYKIHNFKIDFWSLESSKLQNSFESVWDRDKSFLFKSENDITENSYYLTIYH